MDDSPPNHILPPFPSQESFSDPPTPPPNPSNNIRRHLLPLPHTILSRLDPDAHPLLTEMLSLLPRPLPETDLPNEDLGRQQEDDLSLSPRLSAQNPSVALGLLLASTGQHTGEDTEPPPPLFLPRPTDGGSEEVQAHLTVSNGRDADGGAAGGADAHAEETCDAADPDDSNVEGRSESNESGSIRDPIVSRALELIIQHLSQGDNVRYGSAPASKDAIEALRTLNFSKSSSQEEEDVYCAICKEAFELEAELTEMPCKHVYHSGCILPWLELHSTCPLCRSQLPADDSLPFSAGAGHEPGELSIAIFEISVDGMQLLSFVFLVGGVEPPRNGVEDVQEVEENAAPNTQESEANADAEMEDMVVTADNFCGESVGLTSGSKDGVSMENGVNGLTTEVSPVIPDVQQQSKRTEMEEPYGTECLYGKEMEEEMMPLIRSKGEGSRRGFYDAEIEEAQMVGNTEDNSREFYDAESEEAQMVGNTEGSSREFYDAENEELQLASRSPATPQMDIAETVAPISQLNQTQTTEEAHDTLDLFLGLRVRNLFSWVFGLSDLNRNS